MENDNTSTKFKIITSALNLFQKKGYDNTTVNDIISSSGYSKGTFYHYFSNKEDILIAWNEDFDNIYDNWYCNLSKETHSIDKLKEFNDVVLSTIEFHGNLTSISVTHASQITTKKDRYYTDSNRSYNMIINDILKEGQVKNEIRSDISYIELAKMYKSIQRGVIYDWCLSNGTYSLKEFGIKTMNIFISKFS